MGDDKENTIDDRTLYWIDVLNGKRSAEDDVKNSLIDEIVNALENNTLSGLDFTNADEKEKEKLKFFLSDLSKDFSVEESVDKQLEKLKNAIWQGQGNAGNSEKDDDAIENGVNEIIEVYYQCLKEYKKSPNSNVWEPLNEKEIEWIEKAKEEGDEDATGVVLGYVWWTVVDYFRKEKEGETDEIKKARETKREALRKILDAGGGNGYWFQSRLYSEDHRGGKIAEVCRNYAVDVYEKLNLDNYKGLRSYLAAAENGFWELCYEARTETKKEEPWTPYALWSAIVSADQNDTKADQNDTKIVQECLANDTAGAAWTTYSLWEKITDYKKNNAAV